MSDRRFFILDERLPVTSIPKLLGRVVADKYLPLQKSAPFASTTTPHNPQDIIPYILPEPSVSTKQKESVATSHEQDLPFTLIFTANWARSNQATLEMQTDAFKKYAFEDPDEIFDTLMENELYAADVLKFISMNKKNRTYLVTGFMTATGTLWKRTNDQSLSSKFSVKLPISQAVAPFFPLPIDLIIGPSQKTTVGRTSEMRVDEEQIFAVSYSLVKVKRRFDKNSPRFMKKTPVIGPPMRANMRQLAMGEDEDEDEDEGVEETNAEDDVEVDLFLVDVDEEEEDANTEVVGTELLL